MEPKGYMPYYEEPYVMAEIDIRGRFMMMACDIEWSMLSIIMYSTTDPYNHHRANKFEGMMMNEKIQNTICDLKKYHPNYYNEYKQEMGQLMEFKQIRNDMGHYTMKFNDASLQSFKMQYIGECDGQEKVLYKTYNIDQMKNIISKFRKTNIKLTELVEKLKEDYNAKIIQDTN